MFSQTCYKYIFIHTLLGTCLIISLDRLPDIEMNLTAFQESNSFSQSLSLQVGNHISLNLGDFNV